MNVVMSIKEKLIVGQMALDKVSISTIIFYMMVKDLLDMEGGTSCAECARVSFMSSQAAARHLSKLQQAGYARREGYRSWKKAPQMLKDGDLMFIVDMLKRQGSKVHSLDRPAAIAIAS
jgi:hypothetical protein